jgi:hypothetical protein
MNSRRVEHSVERAAVRTAPLVISAAVFRGSRRARVKRFEGHDPI